MVPCKHADSENKRESHQLYETECSNSSIPRAQAISERSSVECNRTQRTNGPSILKLIVPIRIVHPSECCASSGVLQFIAALKFGGRLRYHMNTQLKKKEIRPRNFWICIRNLARSSSSVSHCRVRDASPALVNRTQVQGSNE